MKFLLVIALLLLPQQQVTDPEFVCTFSIKPEKPLTDPTVHIHVLVHGKSEADAAIHAFKYLQGFVREEKLTFMEATLKK